MTNDSGPEFTDDDTPIDWAAIDFERFTIDPADAAPRDIPVNNVGQLSRIPHGTDRTLPWDLIPQTPRDDDIPGILPAATPGTRAALDETLAVYRRGLAARVLTAGLDHPRTRAVAVRLGDLLATAGQLTESFDVYKSVVERSADVQDDAEVRRAARRAAVIATTGSEQAHDPAKLPGPIPQSISELATNTHARADIVDEVASDVRDAIDRVDDFVAVLQRWQRISRSARDDKTMSALAETVVESSAAARLRIAEIAAFDDQLPISKLLEALLDSEHGLRHRAVAYHRGRRHRMRFADMMIIESPLRHGTRSRHIEAVLRERFGPRRDATIRDVVYLTGSMPEMSHVLLAAWATEYGLTDREVVINCPYLLRTRAGDIAVNLAGDKPTPAPPLDRLSGVVVTGLGWGGAADAAALLARAWGWGFAAAARTKLEGYPRISYPFGDWSHRTTDSYRQAELADDLIRNSRSLLDALPHLTQRVCALDYPIGAIHALNARATRRTSDLLAVVMVRISERRIRWVARHLLTQGGRKPASRSEIASRAAELSRTQDALLGAVTRQGNLGHVLVVDLIDHLDDGYAESDVPVDPVDDDFDSYFDTAERIRETLYSMVLGSDWSAPLEVVPSLSGC
jgi:hypothetical protein